MSVSLVEETGAPGGNHRPTTYCPNFLFKDTLTLALVGAVFGVLLLGVVLVGVVLYQRKVFEGELQSATWMVAYSDISFPKERAVSPSHITERRGGREEEQEGGGGNKREGLVYWGLTPQKLPGSYQGGEMMMMMMMMMAMMMMMKSVFWWRKPEYPEETTDLW